ncbi:uncharacterized protein LOC143619604 isoform X1 [Bidens hawaiensis]|uniref:uncharacterized protein LOC143619604 isoform X1 n=1 Tax=Bidens hawaiensis TaxID=980011 RepID=UPI00404B3CE3
MNQRRNNRGKRRSHSSSPTRNHRTTSATLLDSQLVTEEDELSLSSDIINNNNKFLNPRSFPYAVKQQCWDKADKIKGRDPDRWRRDPLGNTIFRKLVGCAGCLCHDYDHILPYSKGGQSTLENCQVLQLTDPKGTVLRFLELILFRKALTAGFQGMTWIFLNWQPMAMSAEDKILADVSCNDQILKYVVTIMFSCYLLISVSVARPYLVLLHHYLLIRPKT